MSASEEATLKDIMFIVEPAPEGGFAARAVGESIVTEMAKRGSRTPEL